LLYSARAAPRSAVAADRYLRTILPKVTTPNSPIGQFLARVADMLAVGQTATRAQSDVISNIAGLYSIGLAG